MMIQAGVSKATFKISYSSYSGNFLSRIYYGKFCWDGEFYFMCGQKNLKILLVNFSPFYSNLREKRKYLLKK